MKTVNEMLQTFEEASLSPKKCLAAYKSAGKKVIGCFPFYAPAELVSACGMVPMGVWGAEGVVKEAKEYFPSFYCTIVQMNLQLALTGKLDGLSGVIIPTMCDSLRPLSQNFKAGVKNIPMIFMAHPQQRTLEAGKHYMRLLLDDVRKQLEAISGVQMTDESLQAAIKAHNRSRAERRRFVKNAAAHPDLVSCVKRSAVLKSALFMEADAYADALKELNDELEQAPACQGQYVKILTSGILADNRNLLQIFDDHHIVIAADDIAQETRSFRVDVPENADPMQALVEHFALQRYDTVLYTGENINERATYVAQCAKDAGAQGAVVLMLQFCDLEEMEYPALKEAFQKAGIPQIELGYDQQMTEFAQASTSIQALVDMIG